MSFDNDTEPRVWELPAEPPTGTVVRSEDGSQRWRRLAGTNSDGWIEADTLTGAVKVTQFAISWAELVQGGRVIEVLPTAAEWLADRLINLAGHLNAHPELHTVRIHDTDLQLNYHRDPAATLNAWADSMVTPTMRIRCIAEIAYVYVTGQVGDRTEKVWSDIEGFREFLLEQGILAEVDAEPLDVPIELLTTFATATAEVPSTSDGE